MRTESFHSDRLVELLWRRQIATMAELKTALGSNVDVTVFRKLRPLGYRTSYSHGGRYYTLDAIVLFDDRGLWSARGVWFSRHGTLVKTAEAFVMASEAGYYVEELDQVLHVGTKDVLRSLLRMGRVGRQMMSGRHLYCSRDEVTASRQVEARRLYECRPRLGGSVIGAEAVSDELKAAMVLFYSLLDEKQRRLCAGLESLKLGHGGDVKVAEFLGVDPHTVARGRQQLLEQDFEVERIRRKGAGRRRVEKKRQKSSNESRS
jgi:hypothetical protein